MPRNEIWEGIVSKQGIRKRATRITSGLAAITVAAAGLALTSGAGAAAAPPGDRSGPPAEVLAERLRGEAAIEALGARLPDVAARNDTTPAALVRSLRSDNQLWVDPTGTLLYIDETLADQADEPAVEAIDPTFSDHPAADALLLHSRPGAQRVVYLDFDGHDPSTSAWKDKSVTAPYDVDGDPSTFSDVERRVIIDVWRHVSEDFAPFAVDVTTEEPPVDAIRRTDVSDQAYGTRVVITPTMSNCASCGGVAYVGTYDWYGGSESTGWNHDLYQPAWVYNGGTGAKSIAEAVSHEAGHNLGLNHDDTSRQGYYAGHGDWAPIMGVGYYEPISQWSQGEYADAQNQEDDFSVVGSNGGPLAADDHGDTAAAATPLADPLVDVDGAIGTRTDLDVFSITTEAGLLSLAATPAPIGPNLDIALTVRDDAGQVLAASDPAGLAASLDLVVADGTYTLTVDGVGVGDPATDGYSDYGSVGRYRLTGTLPAGQVNQPPSARPTSDATTGTAPLDVTFDAGDSTDVDGTIVSYRWDFGDGAPPADTATATHRYEAIGSYSATLTVTDDDGAVTTSDPIEIEVVANQAPFVDAGADVLSGRAPLAVNLIGNDVFDPEGDALTYEWVLDGAFLSNEQDVLVILEDEGEHTAVLTVTDSHGNQATDTVVITVEPNAAPVAHVIATPTSGTAPFEVSFDGSGSSDANGDELSYTWTFGDDTTSSGVTTSHTFQDPGTYTATLTVSDDQLSDSATVTIVVDEPATPPEAPVLAQPTVATDGTVALDWTDVTGATDYTVYREFRHKSGSYRGWGPVATVATSSFADQPGSGTYRYQVVANHPDGPLTSNLVTVTVTSGSDGSGGGGGGGKGGGRGGSAKAR